jgi:hypothetical protein
VIVLGTELPGLIYAALAARHGYRVAVIGNRAQANTYRHKGHVFLYEPERFYGFSTSPAISTVMKDLTLSMEMKNRPQMVEPILQIVTPDMRLDVPAQANRWRRELEREMPKLSEQLLAFEDWASAETEATNSLLLTDDVYPPEGMRASSRYESLVSGLKVLSEETNNGTPGPIASIHDRSEFSSIIGAPISHLTQVRHDPAGPLTLARLWTHLRAGIYRLPEGVDGLKRIFLRKMQEQCGDFRSADVAHQLVFRRRRVKEVLLQDRGETLGCELLVANMDPRQLGQMIRPADRVERYHLDVATKPLAGWRLTINIALNPRVIPAGMGPELVLVQDTKSNLIGSNCIWVSRPGWGRYGSRDTRPGSGVLCITAILPAEGDVPTLSGVQRLLAHVQERLRGVIPWFDEHVLTTHLPCVGHDAESGKSVLRHKHLLPVARDPEPMMLGIGTNTPTTPYKNILVTGESIMSGLGVEGSFLTALQALERTRSLVKIKNTLG